MKFLSPEVALYLYKSTICPCMEYFCHGLHGFSVRLHVFSVTIPRCYKDVFVNTFFPRTARLWGSLPIECFPLTYDLSGFTSRINRHLLIVGSFWTDFLYAVTFFVLLFLVTPCLVVAVQPCMEWIPIKKKSEKVCVLIWRNFDSFANTYLI